MIKRNKRRSVYLSARALILLDAYAEQNGRSLSNTISYLVNKTMETDSEGKVDIKGVDNDSNRS